MRLRPLHDWVLIKRMEPDERTAGGIIIPSSAKEKPSEGVVQAIGPGRYKTEKGKKEKKFIPTVLKPGERVLFVDYKARDIAFDGEDITLIREGDILGIYENVGPAERRSFRSETGEQPPAGEENAGARVKKSRQKNVLSVPGTKPKKAKPKKTVAVRRPTKAVKKVAKSTAGKKKPVPKKSKKTIIPKPPKKMLPKKEKAKRTTAARKTSKKVAERTVLKKTPAKKIAPKKAVLKKTLSKKTGASKIAAKAVKKSVSSKGKKRSKK